MKKILIAVDYDPSAQKIVEMGYSLGKSINATVILLHVIADSVYYSSLQYSPVMGFGGFSPIDDIATLPDAVDLNKAAMDFLQKTKIHLGDETIQTLTGEGETATVILKVAKEMEVDIIVIGSHGRSGLNKLLMGNVAEEVLHHSSIPLFVIPTKL